MLLSHKYSRTFHFPFSPGTTSDDRINTSYWQDLCRFDTAIHTEKLDGENNCLNKWGVFARSHATPTTSPWTTTLRQKWELIKRDLGDYEIFGENLYAIHSILYPNIEEHYYVFAVREGDSWLSWEEVAFIARAFDLPTVPVLEQFTTPRDKNSFEMHLLQIAQQGSAFGSVDTQTGKPCSMEGIVTRNIQEFGVADFQHNVFKYVRKNHVKTDKHWTRNLKRAGLKNETK